MIDQAVLHPARRIAWPPLLGAVALGLVIAALLAWFMVQALRPQVLHGMVLQSAEPAADFTLTSHNGQPVSLSDFRGKLVLLFFGYTSCPKVCPATMAELHRARQQLGRRADQVQVLMVSVDPERDSGAALGSFLGHFDPSFIGLTGSRADVTAIATRYGTFFERQEGTSALGYAVDHTSTTLLIDREGHPRLLFPFGTSGDDIAADLDYVLRR